VCTNSTEEKLAPSMDDAVMHCCCLLLEAQSALSDNGQR
jgi:hypothetical protein